MIDIQEFKPKAKGFLIEQAVAIADHYIEGYEKPDTSLYEEVESFMASLDNEFSERTAEETASQIDYYLNQISSDLFYIGNSEGDELKVVYEEHIAVPEGGVPENEFLTKAADGTLKWGAPKSPSKIAEELSTKDGQGRVKFISGKWQQSTDGGATYAEIGSGTQEGEQPSLINDDVASETTAFSSTKTVSLLGNKVDKVDGKGLSKNDFTDTLKAKVDKIITTGTGAKVFADNGAYRTISELLAEVGEDGGGNPAYLQAYDNYAALDLDDSPKPPNFLAYLHDATGTPGFPKVGDIKWGVLRWDATNVSWALFMVGDSLTALQVAAKIKAEAEGADFTNTDTSGVLHDGTAAIKTIKGSIRAIADAWNNRLDWLKTVFETGIKSKLGLNIAPTHGLHQLGGSHKLQALLNPAAPTVTVVGAKGVTGVAEVASLQITAAPTAAGNVTITLDGVATTVAVDPAIETTAIAVADKIRAANFTGWTTGGTAGTDTVTFTANATGAKTDATYSEGTTGATGTMTTTTQGVTDTRTVYDYFVVAEDNAGFQTIVSPKGGVTDGNPTLDATNYNTVSWTTVDGAVKYHVLRNDTASLIASVTGTSFNDTGVVATAFTAPTRNQTADLYVDGKIIGDYPTLSNDSQYFSI
jgi:hypothetical protein